MKSSRRDFVRLAVSSGITLTGSSVFPGLSSCGDRVRTKNKVAVEITNVELRDGTLLTIPYWRIESGRDGPALLLIASQHGNEVQGAEVARRFADVCASQLVSGNVWLIPMANPQAVRRRRHSVNLGPEEPITKARLEGYNMNLVWPGNPEGNDTERTAYALTQSVLHYCSHLVDMHCWSHFTAAETLSVNDHEASRPLGEVTTTRFISYRSTPKLQMASQVIRQQGGGAIEIELSGQFQMRERQIITGLDSMVNIAILLGMIKDEPKLLKGKRAVRETGNSHILKAPCSGLFVPAAGKDKRSNLIPDDYVEEGQTLGYMIRDNDLGEVIVTSPVTGYLWQIGACHSSMCDQSLPAQHPYTEEGETISCIVTV